MAKRSESDSTSRRPSKATRQRRGKSQTASKASRRQTSRSKATSPSKAQPLPRSTTSLTKSLKTSTGSQPRLRPRWSNREVRAKRAERHLVDFIKFNKSDYIADSFHIELCKIIEKFHADVLAKKSPRVIIVAPPQHGKQLADDTPVFTPGGWKTHGALVVGDHVFGPDGIPVAVLAVSEPSFQDRE